MELVVADMKEEVVQEAVKNFRGTAAPSNTIRAQDVDIFTSCALGMVINDATLPQIHAQAICSLAKRLARLMQRFDEFAHGGAEFG